MKAMKCTCLPRNAAWFVLQAVVYALGLIGIVVGLQSVWEVGVSIAAVLWTTVGFLVIALGKLLKTKTHAGCPMYQ